MDVHSGILPFVVEVLDAYGIPQQYEVEQPETALVNDLLGQLIEEMANVGEAEDMFEQLDRLELADADGRSLRMSAYVIDVIRTGQRLTIRRKPLQFRVEVRNPNGTLDSVKVNEQETFRQLLEKMLQRFAEEQGTPNEPYWPIDELYLTTVGGKILPGSDIVREVLVHEQRVVINQRRRGGSLEAKVGQMQQEIIDSIGDDYSKWRNAAQASYESNGKVSKTLNDILVNHSDWPKRWNADKEEEAFKQARKRGRSNTQQARNLQKYGSEAADSDGSYVKAPERLIPTPPFYSEGKQATTTKTAGTSSSGSDGSDSDAPM